MPWGAVEDEPPFASRPSCLARPWAPTAGGCFASSSCFLATFFSLCLRSSSLSSFGSRGARFLRRACRVRRAASAWVQRVSMVLRTVLSTWSRMRTRALPDGTVPLAGPVSRMSSMAEVHFFSALLSGFSK